MRTKNLPQVEQKWISSHLNNMAMDLHLSFIPSWRFSWLNSIDMDILQYEIPNQITWILSWMDKIQIEENDIADSFASQLVFRARRS